VWRLKMTAKMFFKKASLVLLKICLQVLYALILIVTCLGVAIIFSSPVVLGYVTVVNYLDKPITILGGKILYLWLSAVAVIFVPLLIYSIVYRIRQRVKQKKALQEAMTQAKAEGEDK
jgi:hypothetical protein